ncbi:hypothetical protein [Paraburkholderia fungorum]|uniref:hypothetical protein n=1 Tax=Paraburkholderia fungorum TaxID=134537 RepID=UPI001F45D51A|nr:hypothetical protein [Paraburkholderia fungorum]
MQLLLVELRRRADRCLETVFDLERSPGRPKRLKDVCLGAHRRVLVFEFLLALLGRFRCGPCGFSRTLFGGSKLLSRARGAHRRYLLLHKVVARLQGSHSRQVHCLRSLVEFRFHFVKSRENGQTGETLLCGSGFVRCGGKGRKRFGVALDRADTRGTLSVLRIDSLDQLTNGERFQACCGRVLFEPVCFSLLRFRIRQIGRGSPSRTRSMNTSLAPAMLRC